MSLRHTTACLSIALVALGGFARAQVSETGKTTASEEQKDPDAKPQIPKNAAVDATVWGAVVYATMTAGESGSQTKDPKEFPNYARRLGKIKEFSGYKHFELIGQHTQKIFSEYTNWVVPSKELFLNVDSKGPAEDGGINLHVQLWRRTKVLVKTDTTLKKSSPLIIGGPKWRDGQLIFVLLLK
jgi:hypothetical protein